MISNVLSNCRDVISGSGASSKKVEAEPRPLKAEGISVSAPKSEQAKPASRVSSDNVKVLEVDPLRSVVTLSPQEPRREKLKRSSEPTPERASAGA